MGLMILLGQAATEVAMFIGPVVVRKSVEVKTNRLFKYYWSSLQLEQAASPWRSKLSNR